jgi:hypothetical protein
MAATRHTRAKIVIAGLYDPAAGFTDWVGRSIQTVAAIAWLMVLLPRVADRH